MFPRIKLSPTFREASLSDLKPDHLLLAVKHAAPDQLKQTFTNLTKITSLARRGQIFDSVTVFAASVRPIDVGQIIVGQGIVANCIARVANSEAVQNFSSKQLGAE